MVEQRIKYVLLPNQNKNEQKIENRYLENEIPNWLIDYEQKEKKNHPRVSPEKIRAPNDRFVFAPGGFEGFLAPGIPVHRVVLVLEEVRRRFSGEEVGVMGRVVGRASHRKTPGNVSLSRIL